MQSPSTAEKIIKEVFRFRDFSISIEVNLGSKNKSEQKIPFIFSTKFKTEQYSNINNVDRIILKSREYLVFKMNRDGEYASAYFSQRSLFEMDSLFSYMLNLLYKEDLFYVNKKELLKVNKESEGYFKEKLEGANNKSIGFIPSVLDEEEAITLFFSSKKTSVKLRLDEFESLCYYIKRLDLIQTSLLMMNTLSLVPSSPRQERG